MRKQTVTKVESKAFYKMLLIEVLIFAVGIGISILAQSDIGVGIASVVGVGYFFIWMFFGPLKTTPAPEKKPADISVDPNRPYGEFQEAVEFLEEVGDTAKDMLIDDLLDEK